MVSWKDSSVDKVLGRSEVLSSKPQFPCNKLGIVVHTYNHSTGKGGQRQKDP